MGFVNGDFETGDFAPGWVNSGAASIVDYAPHTGTFHLYLEAYRDNGPPIVVHGSAIHQTLGGLAVGNVVSPELWVNHDISGTTTGFLTVQADPLGGTNFTETIGHKQGSSFPAGYSLWLPGSVIAGAGAVTVRIAMDQDWGPFTGQDAILVDDVDASVSFGKVVMPSRKRIALEKIAEKLMGIRGSASGYFSDLGGRVYTVLVPPDANANIQTPYACLVPVGDGRPSSLDGIQQGEEHVWTARLYVFLRDDEANRLTSPIGAELADLEEDILKAIMTDVTLGKTVNHARVLAYEDSAGLKPGEDYGECMFVVECRQYLDVEVMGP